MTDADFSGYATKAGLKCTDGRTITPEAFKEMDGKTVPLVWQHGHNEPSNVLGHAVLEAREDGVYAYGYFNKTVSAKNTRELVEHGDIKMLSIYANQLKEKAKTVLHGVIREVSLVLAGANPGAFIDYVAIAHGDGDIELLEDEAVIYTGLEFSTQGEESEDDVKHAEGDDDGDDDSDDDVSVGDIIESMTDEQRDVMAWAVGEALKQYQAEHSEDRQDGDLEHNEEGTQEMNVFEDKENGSGTEAHVLTHDAIRGIVEDADNRNVMLSDAVKAYAMAHGITDIEVLFPEHKTVGGTPEWESRRMEWVAGVLNSTNKTPFARIKTRSADITHEEARAKGYIKGNMKKEEFFSVKSRTTGPTTVYKKQSLDRDDIIDITDFDVVAWVKGEMRMMLEEEMARAVLIGDGREVDDEDKIKDPLGATEGTGIRSVLNDHELYVTTVNVNLDDTDSSYEEAIERILRFRRFYKGSGAPTFYTTTEHLVEMLLLKDNMGRKLYQGRDDLANTLMVKAIVEVEALEDEPDVVGIIVNLRDYNIGADRGGQTTLFDDFDIDYNKYKYLLETRVSGALTKIKSAMVVRKTSASSVEVVPPSPAFDGEEITITNTTGVVYRDLEDDTVMNNAGSPYAVASGETVTVYATPDTGYHFPSTENDTWAFTNNE